MADVLVTEPVPMAKKRKPPQQTYSLNASGEARVEFVAPVDWLKKLDALAKSLGLNRSAYIRLACNRQMASDERQTSDHLD